MSLPDPSIIAQQFDNYGRIYIARVKRRDQVNVSYVTGISLSGDFELLQPLQTEFRGSLTRTHWEARASHAVHFLRWVYPNLRRKRSAAWIALCYEGHKARYRMTRTKDGKLMPHSDNEIVLREAARQTLIKLMKKLPRPRKTRKKRIYLARPYDREQYRIAKKRTRERKIEALGGKCYLCLTKICLEFHHPHRRLSETMKHGTTWEDIRQGQVMLLCKLCHRAINRVLYWKRIGAVSEAVTIAGEPVVEALKVQPAQTQ